MRNWLSAATLGALAVSGVLYVRHSRSTSLPEGSKKVASAPEYAQPNVCAGCHPAIAQAYSRTGMGRSFHSVTPRSLAQEFGSGSRFYHKVSGSYFEMIERQGKYFQRRYQLDFAGKPTNIMEKEVNYVIGSGNHVRTYLNRTRSNELLELPVAWYEERGGYWAMNPGYDRPDHDQFQRRLSYACMFCHNNYPEIPPGSDQPGSEPVFRGSLPEGIDCERCHGPGQKHSVLAGQANARKEDIRNAILNPSRLSTERQMELCMQCHLETTSSSLPNAIRRYDRGPFSYLPGQPLGDFILQFDHAAGKGRDEKFEIVSAAYRLRRSECFLKSAGALLCTTCHNPHESVPDTQAASRYSAVCRRCHGGGFNSLVVAGRHPVVAECISCHMPKRRAEDVVHSVMTDHYIQRRKPGSDLLKDIAEHHDSGEGVYHGKVVLYYPPQLPADPERDLYLAAAQVAQQSNLMEGITQLTAAVGKYKPARAGFYLDLADALCNDGKVAEALPVYEEALRLAPDSPAALRKFGVALDRSGQHRRAAEALEKALKSGLVDPATWHELGLIYLNLGRKPEAIAALRKALDADPDDHEVHNSLGGIRAELGDPAQAEAEFREAIRIRPQYAEAHNNLAGLLSSAGKFAEARYHFETALQFHPNYPAARYNYAQALLLAGQITEAQRQLESALRENSQLAPAHLLLGDLLASRNRTPMAIQHYKEALRMDPSLGAAQLSLGLALAGTGDRAALPYLEAASRSAEPNVREEAHRVLQRLKRKP